MPGHSGALYFLATRGVCLHTPSVCDSPEAYDTDSIEAH
jgi:hypothetical protein